MPSTTSPAEDSGTTTEKYNGFTAEERAAMKEHAREEKKAAARRGSSRAEKEAAAERDVLAKIAEMPEADRVLAERIHEIIKTAAPDLAPKLWYGIERIDGNALDVAIGSWLAARDPDRLPSGQDPLSGPRRSLAVDGKTVRGARRSDGTQVHLLAAMTATGLVTAQREVDGKTNEITVFRPMLAELDLADTVVTFDALHSQTAHARARTRKPTTSP